MELSKTQELREPEGAHSQMVKGEGSTPVGHEDIPREKKLDGTHLKGEQLESPAGCRSRRM